VLLERKWEKWDEKCWKSAQIQIFPFDKMMQEMGKLYKNEK